MTAQQWSAGVATVLFAGGRIAPWGLTVGGGPVWRSVKKLGRSLCSMEVRAFTVCELKFSADLAGCPGPPIFGLRPLEVTRCLVSCYRVLRDAY